MKLTFPIIFMILLLGNNNADAQRKRPTLDIMLSDNNPFQLVINGRTFPNINNKISIKDLPARKNNIEIIRYCTNSDGNDCKKRIVFSGAVPMQHNKQYQAVVLVGESKLRVSDDGSLFANYMPQNVTISPQGPNPAYQPISPSNPNATLPSAEFSEFQRTAQLKTEVSKNVLALGEDMKTFDSDKDRLSKALAFINNSSNNLSVKDIHVISSWIMYDEQKLTLVKESYDLIDNRKDFKSLITIFTMKNYADEFENFLNTKQ